MGTQNPRYFHMALCLVLLGCLAATGSALSPTTGIIIAQAGQTRKSTDPPVPPHGKLGQDLFLAIDHRDLPAVQDLLKRGADPNSTNGLGFVPIYIAAASHQTDVMQALIDAGADPNHASTYGTPLSFACVTANLEGANLLFSKGVKADFVRTDGITPLIDASNAGFPPLVAELLKHKVDVNVQDDGGDSALFWAARQGNTPVVDMLTGAGGKVDVADVDGLTPLMAASMNGHADIAGMLLKKGAKPNAKDEKGRTALVLTATYGDHPDVIRALLAGGANPKAKDAKGRTAATLAAMRGYSQTVALLGGSSKIITVAYHPRDPRQAINLSLKTLEASNHGFNEGAACVSCHQQGLGRMTTGEARLRGFQVDAKVEAEQKERINGMVDALRPLHEKALTDAEAMKQVPLMEMNEVTTMDTWLLAGMADQHQPANEGTAAMAMVLATQQKPTGEWTFSLPRVPMQSSVFTFTALSIRALDVYGPRAHSAEIADRIAKAKAWLLQAKPQNSEDRASRLLGLKWANADAKDKEQAAAEILADQRGDGGWAQLPNLQSDAYATGQALFALHVGGGLPVQDAAYQRGAQFLLRTQDDDGTWFVNKRALPANNYFDAGFPHGESQYASYNGTCWATLALLQTVGPKSGPVARR